MRFRHIFGFILLTLAAAAGTKPATAPLYRSGTAKAKAEADRSWELFISVADAGPEGGGAARLRVKIRRRGKAKADGLLLLVLAQADNGKAGERRLDHPAFDPGQRGYEADFILENADCGPVRVQAHLIRDDETLASAFRTLTFDCSENRP